MNQHVSPEIELVLLVYRSVMLNGNETSEISKGVCFNKYVLLFYYQKFSVFFLSPP